MSGVGQLHGKLVFNRRVRALVNWLGQMLPEEGRVLDIGCGSGLIARLLSERKPGLRFEGVDVLVREGSAFPVTKYDGLTLPFADRYFDAAIIVDVLHHADDARAVLREAARVTGGRVVIKDHYLQGFCARSTLRFMDWVGNAHHGVALPWNYWRPAEWRSAFADSRLTVEREVRKIGLYPWPAGLVFERGLHFIASLRPAGD